MDACRCPIATLDGHMDAGSPRSLSDPEEDERDGHGGLVAAQRSRAVTVMATAAATNTRTRNPIFIGC